MKLIEYISRIFKKSHKNVYVRDFNINSIENQSGSGTFRCIECDYTKVITPFIHGGIDDEWCMSTYQCQSCGKLEDIENPDFEINYNCSECNGNLSRTKKMFCPDCESKKGVLEILCQSDRIYNSKGLNNESNT